MQDVEKFDHRDTGINTCHVLNDVLEFPNLHL